MGCADDAYDDVTHAFWSALAGRDPRPNLEEMDCEALIELRRALSRLTAEIPPILVAKRRQRREEK